MSPGKLADAGGAASATCALAEAGASSGRVFEAPFGLGVSAFDAAGAPTPAWVLPARLAGGAAGASARVFDGFSGFAAALGASSTSVREGFAGGAGAGSSPSSVFATRGGAADLASTSAAAGGSACAAAPLVSALGASGASLEGSASTGTSNPTVSVGTPWITVSDAALEPAGWASSAAASARMTSSSSSHDGRMRDA